MLLPVDEISTVSNVVLPYGDAEVANAPKKATSLRGGAGHPVLF